MRRAAAVIGTAIFFVFVPCVLAGVVPWWISRWEFLPPFFDLQATRAVGILLMVAGLPGLVDSFARFALQGLGTPAPIAPPQHLVVTGLYRYVRNPMSWPTRSRCWLIALAPSTRISAPTSRAGFHGSRPGEPHEARI